jgi:hypothetical protein
VFQMKDLMMHVQPAGGMLLFPDTCRISGAETNPKGHTGCQRHSARPDRVGQDDPPPDPHPGPKPACEDSRPAGDRDRGPRRASGLDVLRRALRAELAPGG